MSALAAELSDAVVGSLKRFGRYDKIKGQVRKELFELLAGANKEKKTQISQENFVINELIREYLQFNGYSNSLSVFQRETGQPDESLSREFLAQSVNVTPHRHIPVLYSLAATDTTERLPEEGLGGSDPSDDGFFEIRSL